jgi:protein O-GlcNAc transferase
MNTTSSSLVKSGKANRDFQSALSALQAGNLPNAERFFSAVLRAEPKHVGALNLMGIVLMQLKRFAEAETYFRRASQEHPKSDAMLYNYGLALKALNRPLEALQRFNEALQINPSVAETWNNRGTVFNDLKRYDEAIVDFDKATSLNPRYAEAFCNKGKSLAALGDYDQAMMTFERALALKPDLHEAWLGRGNVFFDLKQYHDALVAFDRALELSPDFTQAWVGRAMTALYLMRYDQAFFSYNKALTLDPHVDYAEGLRLLAKLNLCDWTELEAETEGLLSRLREGRAVSAPLVLLSIPSTPADQLRCARSFVKDLPVVSSAWRGEAYSHDRIRVAYLSANFSDHPVAYLMAGLFEQHDKSRFEVIGISFGPAQNSPIRRRLENAFERFEGVGDKTDEEIANLIRDREIDIAVDLMGHTQHARLGIFARRPAPIQVHYLGYAGTLGTNFINYILADPTVIPEEHRPFFAEQVVWLPDSYLVNDNRRAISPRTPTRQECGLPENGFVFCSFNNAYKIVPQIFQVWMRFLRALPDSVLWLSQADPVAMTNLRREAERCAVSAQRLVFAPKVAENTDHLARQRCADLFLDTLPYNAHSTASDALWAGLPVLTCLGETFAGRVAASLLRAVGLPELVTTSLEDYEALALRLAREPSSLAAVKDKLARNRETQPLFDTARFTRHIEAAYITMWERHRCSAHFGGNSDIAMRSLKCPKA